MLCLALLVAAIPVILPVFTSATAADDQEEQLLGTLSQRFEASGPGVISSGSGDAGGKSYGAYQFSSRSDIPRAFFRWCQSSSDTYYRSIGNRLSAAYDADGGYGSNFDATWRALANEDSDGFLRVQRNYVRRRRSNSPLTGKTYCWMGKRSFWTAIPLTVSRKHWIRPVQMQSSSAGNARHIATMVFGMSMKPKLWIIFRDSVTSVRSVRSIGI